MILRREDEILDAVKACLPPEIHRLLELWPSAVVSGGFIRDVISLHPYKDIDVFGLTGDKASRAGKWLEKECGARVIYEEFKTCAFIMVAGPNSDDSAIMWEEREVQLLHREVAHFQIENVDMFCCSSWYNYPDLQLTDSAVSGQLGIHNPGPNTLQRAKTLLRRGWDCSAAELVSAAKVSTLGWDHNS